MKKYILLIDLRALNDIQSAIDYYDDQQLGLGRRFEETLYQYFKILEYQPYFQIRYDDVRCMPLQEFPFMIHYTLDESSFIIKIRAIFHTSIQPNNWKKRKY